MAAHIKIWNMLVTSGLLPASAVGEIRTEFEGDCPKQTDDPEAILDWLSEKRKISDLQREVLDAGLPGPFRFEQYRIHSFEREGPRKGTYGARHVGTDHPVRLRFFAGSDREDARTWATIRETVAARCQVNSPFVVRLFEYVEWQDYRFVVEADQRGKTLAEKLPAKGRLPWPQALQAAEMMALGLVAIHGQEQAHGRLWPGSVWLQRGGIAQLMWQIPGLHFDPTTPQEPEEDTSTERDRETVRESIERYCAPTAPENIETDLELQQRRDLYSLGAIVFRMLSGKAPKIRSTNQEDRANELKRHVQYCSRYEVPENVQQILSLLLSADVSPELKNSEVTARLIGSVLESQSIVQDQDPDPPTLKPYLDTLDRKYRSSEFLNRLESLDAEAIRTNESDSVPAASKNEMDFSNLSTRESVVSARERLARRKSKPKSNWPLAVFGMILAVAVVTGLVLGGVFTDRPETATGESSNDSAKPLSNGTKDAAAKTARDGKSKSPTEIASPTLVYRPQHVVDQNDDLPWESPTTARPLNVQYLPAAPEFIFAIRPARMMNNEQARRMLQSFGEEFQQLKEAYFDATGLEPDKIERLLVSLHANERRQFSVFTVAELTEATDQESIWQGMNQPSSFQPPESEERLFELGSTAAWFPDKADEQVTHVVWGDRRLVEQATSASGLSMLGPTMAQLVERSDRDRDLTILFRTAALLSEEGTWLFSGNLARLRRPLRLFFDDRMRGVKFSLHFDRGCYLELMTEQTRDLSDRDLVAFWKPHLRDYRDRIVQQAAQIPPHPYWSSVLLRIDNMVNELIKGTRVGRERDGVVVNCWLPEMAPHNLVVAAELLLNGSQFSREPTSRKTTPSTLQELLSRKRTLQVATNPDLVILMRDLEQEIRDDYPDLPFEFRIRLMGNDLREAGITQNQRPGNIDIVDRPLSDLLAQIMLQANPDKSATSPSDPACQLVWVVGPDPENPEVQSILITTRKAAGEKNWPLPDVFRDN